jgi:hypothetical protein
LARVIGENHLADRRVARIGTGLWTDMAKSIWDQGRQGEGGAISRRTIKLRNTEK